MDKIAVVQKKGTNYVLFEIAGNVNSYTYADLQAKILPHIRTAEVILDLAQVTSLSSSGIGVLMVCYEDGEKFGHKLYIMNPSFIAKKAIESTGFLEYFPVIFSLTEVL